LNITDKRYSHRGDAKRRRQRIGKFVLVACLLAAVAYIPRQRPKDAEASTFGSFTFAGSQEAARLRAELDATKGELALAHAQLDRAKAIMDYSGRFKVNASIAEAVYDVALAEGIDPELGFRVVRVESEFNPRAVSSVGAVGLTQLMPSTARLYQKGVTVDDLYKQDVNLRIGFRYLHYLVGLFDGNVDLALTAYNRGEDKVYAEHKAGLNPRNGYSKAVMGAYKGKGIIQQQGQPKR